jgi:hypothetical protein
MAIVAYRSVAKPWFCKQWPLLGNARNMQAIIELFSVWSVPRCYNREVWSLVSLVEFCTGGCEERTWAFEIEESPLLEAVAREWLVKTQQAGKGLACAVVVCELWRLAVVLQLRVCKWSVDPFTDPNAVYSHSYYVTICNPSTEDLKFTRTDVWNNMEVIASKTYSWIMT